MESRSEWKGTNAELLAELKKVAEALKIDTKSNLWLNSTHKLNQILQELKIYLEEFGITIDRNRYARIIRIFKQTT
jgi:hypothetical protein